MTTFALVHGAWHGAWCWELLVGELEQRGHRAVAVDLPSGDTTATFEDYADCVAAAMSKRAEQDQEIVVVGHSLGGYTIPLVTERVPVRHLVYLCALVADPGRSAVDQERADRMLNPAYPKGLSGPRVDGCTRWVDLDLARSLFCADCPDDIAVGALARLRPQALYPLQQPFVPEALPSTPSTYIVCTDDRMLDTAWSRRVAQERLGAPLIELPGGHSPYFSRPSALADVLDRLA